MKSILFLILLSFVFPYKLENYENNINLVLNSNEDITISLYNNVTNIIELNITSLDYFKFIHYDNKNLYIKKSKSITNFLYKNENKNEFLIIKNINEYKININISTSEYIININYEIDTKIFIIFFILIPLTIIGLCIIISQLTRYKSRYDYINI